jgi:putative FmdB family regulatory protein
MPTYQYRCLDCRKRFEIFMTYADYGQRAVTCTHCRSARIERRITRIRIAKSEESRLDDIADPDSLEGLEDDPRALGRMMRKMSTEMGGEMGEEMGPEFEEVIDRLEKGQSPEEIEKELPDLGSEESPMGGMGGDDLDDF